MTDIDSDGYATADELCAGDLDLDGEDLTLSSGKRVRLRGLTRYELMFNGKGLKEDDAASHEVRNVKSCLIKPAMTVQQIEQWRKNSKAGGDFKELTEAIRERSGLADDADKSGLPADGDDVAGV